MTRILFWTLLVILVVAAVRSKLRGSGFFGGRDATGGNPTRRPPRAGEIENMTECAHCHLHFPASEAVQVDGLDYCSPAHVRLPPL